MNPVAAALRQALGLFVDDGAFATAILAWLAIVDLIAHEVQNARPLCGPLLFLGLAVILAAGTIRRAGR